MLKDEIEYIEDWVNGDKKCLTFLEEKNSVWFSIYSTVVSAKESPSPVTSRQKAEIMFRDSFWLI